MRKGGEGEGERERDEEIERRMEEVREKDCGPQRGGRERERE